MTDRNPFWIQTHAKRQRFDLANPRAEDVRIEDIAYALSMLCRFTGHCERFYSVAQHSIHVAELVHENKPEWALAALLHDAEEAYIGDLSSPLKALIRSYSGGELILSDIVYGVSHAIKHKFGLLALSNEQHATRRIEIKAADLKMLATERRDLMPEPPTDGADWFAATGVVGSEPAQWAIPDYGAMSIVERVFIERFYQYGGQ